MTNSRVGNWVIIGIVIVNILLWFIFPPEPNWTEDPKDVGHMIGELFSSTAMILMGLAITLATKPRWLEGYFGGLDKMYRTHRRIAMLAFLLLIAHVIVIPRSGVGGIGAILGRVAMFGIVVMVLLTIAPRVPLISDVIRLSYDKWRLGHKLLGVFFIMGLFHYRFSEAYVLDSVPGFYLFAFVALGIGAYLYKQIVSGWLRPTFPYTVAQVNPLSGTATEVVLQPAGSGRLSYEAGQFLFIHFEEDKVLSEPHPFTISSSPREENLRVSIRAAGDWTGYLHQNLKAGMTAKVSGGHGRFLYKDGGDEQIWIAGGIGVTPFVSWVRDLGDNCPKKIDFFYTVRHASEVLFWDEFETAADQHENLNVHLQASSSDGRLTPELVAQQVQGDIQNKSIYLCGPIKMTEGMADRFKEMGVPAGQIHFEEFNFR